MTRTKVLSVFAAALMAGAAIAGTANAEAYKPGDKIKILQGFKPGGGSDMLAQLILPFLQKEMNVTFVNEYIPGAAGAIAWAKLGNATKNDGYTISITNSPMIVSNYLLNDEIKYNVKQFEPLFVDGIELAHHDDHDELLLGLEVVIDGGEVDLSHGGDATQGGGLETIGDEEGFGSVEDAFFGDFASVGLWVESDSAGRTGAFVRFIHTIVSIIRTKRTPVKFQCNYLCGAGSPSGCCRVAVKLGPCLPPNETPAAGGEAWAGVDSGNPGGGLCLVVHFGAVAAGAGGWGGGVV